MTKCKKMKRGITWTYKIINPKHSMPNFVLVPYDLTLLFYFWFIIHMAYILSVQRKYKLLEGRKHFVFSILSNVKHLEQLFPNKNLANIY